MPKTYMVVTVFNIIFANKDANFKVFVNVVEWVNKWVFLTASQRFIIIMPKK